MTASRFCVRMSAAVFAPLLAALLLSACASSNEPASDSAARFLVAPGKYVLYDCADLARTAQKTQARQHELEGLMAKASTTSGGQVVNTIAYRPEYVSLHGDMMDLRQSAIDKKCNFMPGETPGTHAVSNRAIR